MNRRAFLGTTSLAAIAVARRRWRTAPVIGLELNAYDDATLSAVAAIGYRDVVVNDLYAPALRAALQQAGLSASAVHVTTPLLYRGIDRHLAVARALGCKYFVCGRLDPEERRTPQDWHELAAVFNRAGEAARKAGLRFGYRMQGDEANLLVAETDPALVWFEAKSAIPRCFAIDLYENAASAAPQVSVEHYYVQASSIDGARRTFAYLKTLRF